jgi:acetyl-CoA synthetase
MSSDFYQTLHTDFGWHVPQRFNMAQVCSRRWAHCPAHAQQVAVLADGPGQVSVGYSYEELQEAANRL